MTLQEAWEHMKNGAVGIYNEKEYTVSSGLNVLMQNRKYGRLAGFTIDMMEGWEIKDEGTTKL